MPCSRGRCLPGRRVPAGGRSRRVRGTSRGRRRNCRRRRRSRGRGPSICVVDAVADAQAAVLPPALGEAGLFAELGRVAEEDLAGDGEDFGVVEALQQRRQKIGRHAHVAVQQHDDVVLGGAEAGIGAAAEAQILGQREHRDVREMWRAGNRRCHRWSRCPPRGFRCRGLPASAVQMLGDVLREQVSAVPVGDHHGGAR